MIFKKNGFDVGIKTEDFQTLVQQIEIRIARVFYNFLFEIDLSLR